MLNIKPHINKIVLGLLLVLAISLPWIVGQFTLQVFIYIITYSILALAFAACWRLGLIRADIAAWWGVGAYTSALLMTKVGMSFWPTMIIAGLIPVVLGWLIFAITLPRGFVVFFTVGITLAIVIQQVFGGIQFFGGWGGIPNVPSPSIGSYVFTGKTEYYFMGLILLIINLFAYYLLYNSKIGRAWTAIGSNVPLARSVGINVYRYRMSAALIGNFFVGVAGAFYVSFAHFLIPDGFGFWQSLYVQIYCLVGGLTHFLAGPLVGAAVYTLVPEYLRIAEEYQPIIWGVVLILFVIFLPKGLLGVYDQWIKPAFTSVKSRIQRALGNSTSTGRLGG